MRFPRNLAAPLIIASSAVAMSFASPADPAIQVPETRAARTAPAPTEAVPSFVFQCEAWSISGPASARIDALVEATPGDAEAALTAVREAGQGFARQLKASVPVPAGSFMQYHSTAETPMMTVSQGVNSTQTSFSGYQSAGTSLEIKCSHAGTQIRSQFELEMSMFEDAKTTPAPRTQTKVRGEMNTESGALRMFQFVLDGKTTLVFLRATEI